MTFDEAENFCQVKVRFPSRECRNPLRSCCRVQTGGHLYSIHDQRDYDKLKAASVGYNKPIMIGLRSDSAGNWEWTDVSASVPFAARHVSRSCCTGIACRSVLASGALGRWSARTGREQGVSAATVGLGCDCLPPLTADRCCSNSAFYPPTADGADWDCGDPSEGHSCDISGANHGIHDWGTVDDGRRMAFACNSAGETRGNRGSQGDAAVCNNGVPPPVRADLLSILAWLTTQVSSSRTAPHATAPCTPEEAGTRELCVGQGRNRARLRGRLWPTCSLFRDSTGSSRLVSFRDPWPAAPNHARHAPFAPQSLADLAGRAPPSPST